MPINILQKVRLYISGAERTFSRYYSKHYWIGGEGTRSGKGSSIEATSKIRESIPRLMKELEINLLLDAPSGDYFWFKEIDRNFSYIGGDIVKPMIEVNNEKYRDNKTSFIHLDITRGPLPTADLWLCRDCLFHLSIKDIQQAIQNFKTSNIEYFLTTTIPTCSENTDIVTGDARAINLLLPPFSLPAPEQVLDDDDDKVLALWHRASFCLDS
jgi:hypothetical protein